MKRHCVKRAPETTRAVYWYISKCGHCLVFSNEVYLYFIGVWFAYTYTTYSNGYVFTLFPIPLRKITHFLHIDFRKVEISLGIGFYRYCEWNVF